MYDNAGNLVKETDTTDGAVRRIVYDVNGRKTLEINPEQYDASADYLNAAGEY